MKCKGRQVLRPQCLPVPMRFLRDVYKRQTLLYSPELKFYSNRVKMDEKFNTNVQNLHCLGDSSGWTRGLMMASIMGVLMGRRLASEKE